MPEVVVDVLHVVQVYRNDEHVAVLPLKLCAVLAEALVEAVAVVYLRQMVVGEHEFQLAVEVRHLLVQAH